jgi:hypothetical protein
VHKMAVKGQNHISKYRLRCFKRMGTKIFY